MDLTPSERRAAVTAIREWLATYSRGRRPEGYEDAASAARKLEMRLQEVEKQRQENLSHTNEVVVDFGPQGAQ